MPLYFGNYIPERNSFPDKIFVSKIFNLNLENIKNFYFSQPYPNILQIPKVFLRPKEKIVQPPKEKENIIQIKPKEKSSTAETPIYATFLRAEISLIKIK